MFIRILSDGWIVDLAYPFYICFNRSQFKTYKVINDIIISEENKGLFIIGIDTI